MTSLIAKDESGWQRICWLAILLFIVSAYLVAIAPQERSIAAVQAEAQVLYERANANEAIVRDAGALLAARARVVEDVLRLRGEANASTAMAGTVALLNTESARFHVTVRAIAPDTSVSLTPANVDPARTDPLIGQPLTVSVVGRFSDVLHFLADLPRHDVLLEVGVSQLRSNARATASSPLLDATLHATLYRLTPLSSDEVHHASSAL